MGVSGRGLGRKAAKTKAKAKARRKAKAKGKTSRATSQVGHSGEQAVKECATECEVVEVEHGDNATAESSTPAPAAFSPEESPLKEFPVYTVPVPKQRPAKETIRKPETYLCGLINDMVRRMTTPEQHGLHLFFSEYLGTLRVASFCAGTDAPRLVIDELCSNLAAYLHQRFAPPGSNLPTHPDGLHAFAAELDEDKRAFLRDQYDYREGSAKLFGDVRSLGEEVAREYSQNEQGQECKVPRFNMAVGGFPCKDVSAYNAYREHHLQGVQAKAGKTGGTLSGIIKAMRRHAEDDMAVALLENVIGLGAPPSEKSEDGKRKKLDIHSSNLAATLYFMAADAKMFTFAVHIDPRCYGGAQSRNRYYMPAFGEKFMSKCEFSKREAYDWTTSFLQRFSDHGLPVIDDLLFPSSHPVVQDALLEAARLPCPWDTTTVEDSSNKKWPKMHLAVARHYITLT